MKEMGLKVGSINSCDEWMVRVTLVSNETQEVLATEDFMMTLWMLVVLVIVHCLDKLS